LFLLKKGTNFKRLLENNHKFSIMSLNIEKRKLGIVELLSETEDVAIILQIENLLKPKVDFWETLSEKERASIIKGMKDLEEGKRIPYKQFRDKFRKS